MRIFAKGSRRGEGGFTLIEAMIASAIIGFEVMAVVAMLSAAGRSNRFSGRLTAATSLCQSAIEGAKNTAYATLTNALVTQTTLVKPTECFNKNLERIDCSAAAGKIYTRTMTVITNTPTLDVSEIRVSTTWPDERGKVHTVSLFSAISKY
jgi:prepilin-type N-terminal cleavage/methylation domain-containing protein